MVPQLVCQNHLEDRLEQAIELYPLLRFSNWCWSLVLSIQISSKVRLILLVLGPLWKSTQECLLFPSHKWRYWSRGREGELRILDTWFKQCSHTLRMCYTMARTRRVIQMQVSIHTIEVNSNDHKKMVTSRTSVKGGKLVLFRRNEHSFTAFSMTCPS